MTKKEPRIYRIAEIENLSGVSRRTIHFYLQNGILHPPIKTGKTMAYYDETHLRKLKFINKAKIKGDSLTSIQEQISEIEKKEPFPFGKPVADISYLEKNQNKREKHHLKEQGKKTRNAILKLGCKLFREKGYNETKVSDITKKLNIGKGSFYFYFSDKKELFLECVPLIFGELFSTGWDDIRKEKNPVKRLELRAKTVLPVLHEFCDIIQLSKEAIEDSDPKLKKLGREILISIRKPLENDIEKGIQQNLFKQVNSKLISMSMIGILESLYYHQKLDEKITAEQIWSSINDMFITGIVENRGD
ncbi:MAG: TetR family transcriptional regulator [Spirochaetes bacterium]|nr:TetR family transcriptional regulator [Spirochaetota bacterium]